MLLYILLRSSLLSQPIIEDIQKINVVGLREDSNENMLAETKKNPTKLKYSLLTQKNFKHSQTLYMNNSSSILSSNFDSNKVTVFYVSGWKKARIGMPPSSAVLKNNDVNFVYCSWVNVSNITYATASQNVPNTGRELKRFIRFLNSVTGAPFDKMHLIGRGLSSHVVGFAGRELGGKIARITGLDPTGPLWRVNPNRLNKNDAVYVEVSHTSMSLTDGVGMRKRMGDVDFYPNGGKWQPNCTANFCDHMYSYRLFMRSFDINRSKNIGYKCHDFVQLRQDRCSGLPTIPFGNNDLKKSGSGIYRFNTFT